MMKKVKNDLDVLECSIKKLENNKSIIALKLLNEAKFMTEVLQNLKEKIKEEGYVSVFEQGSQKFDRESQALKSYNTTIKNYNTIMKQLNELIPIEKDEKYEGEFDL